MGVMILREGKVLLGRRLGSHGEGEYSFPGGHLEYMESFQDCARREVAEECGVEISNVRFQFVSNVTKYATKHYIHIGLVADWVANEPKLLEPDRCSGWRWYSLDDLPQPMFEMCAQAIECHRTGQSYIDAK